ncbi:MAG: type II secretion system F family protein [Desulfobacula sp.]|uniref:type II secretion system F family protein n=1 Tax=Desulfobacula sp. TaxID=2593537 RepID=UPI0025C3A18C|nr:type II secretion system F family protein [Desulfobacula sp.]MCD4719823.1 type II secretion system F family protein [Desulfobacula sp.]
MKLLIFFMVTLFVFLTTFSAARIKKRTQTRHKIKNLATPGSEINGSHADVIRLEDRTGRLSLKALHYLLICAGITLSPEVFIIIPIVTGLLSALATGFLANSIIIAVAVFVLVMSLPAGFLYFKKKQLEKEIILKMPDIIGIIVRALQIGQSVDTALKEAARAVPGPLGAEIRIVYQEMAMGFSFDQAFHNLENRYQSLSDIKLFCTAFIIQKETGGNLIRVLEALANTIQKRFTFNRRIKTYSAEARLSALIIAMLPFLFGLFAWLFNPDYMSRLTATPIGRIMIYMAVLLEITGFIVMRKMAKVKI